MKFNKHDVEETDWIEKEIELCNVTEEEVWERSKHYQDMPNFENLLIELRFEQLDEWIKRFFPCIKKTDWYLNCRDSAFYVSDEDGDMIEVNSLEEIKAVVKAILNEGK